MYSFKIKAQIMHFVCSSHTEQTCLLKVKCHFLHLTDFSWMSEVSAVYFQRFPLHVEIHAFYSEVCVECAFTQCECHSLVLWSLPWGRPHSRTAVSWSTSPPGDLSQCGPGQSNNPWVLQCSCLSPGWSAGVDWSPSSARPHSPLPQSPWCWSACASPGRWGVSPCWGKAGVCPVLGEKTVLSWKWSWQETEWQFSLQQSPPSAGFHWWVQGEGVSLSGLSWAETLRDWLSCLGWHRSLGISLIDPNLSSGHTDHEWTLLLILYHTIGQWMNLIKTKATMIFKTWKSFLYGETKSQWMDLRIFLSQWIKQQVKESKTRTTLSKTHLMACGRWGSCGPGCRVGGAQYPAPPACMMRKDLCFAWNLSVNMKQNVRCCVQKLYA